MGPLGLRDNIRYRMPVAFGPAPSPRQRPDGKAWVDPRARIRVVNVSFLTDASALQRLLPASMTLDGDPIVTVEFMYITELQWLAGRGYNTLGVRFPVRYRTATREYKGPFLSVLWENKADPIITGREELGYAKLFCDIPAPRQVYGREHYEAHWEGHRFLEMCIEGLSPSVPGTGDVDGTLHYRYVPRVGCPGTAEAEGVVLSPPTVPEWIDHATGQGRVRFVRSTWEQLPTLSHIVNTLADLPVVRSLGATVSNLRCDTSLHLHRAIE